MSYQKAIPSSLSRGHSSGYHMKFQVSTLGDVSFVNEILQSCSHMSKVWLSLMLNKQIRVLHENALNDEKSV